MKTTGRNQGANRDTDDQRGYNGQFHPNNNATDSSCSPEGTPPLRLERLFATTRPPGFAREDDLAPTLANVKASVKATRPEDRATLLAWLSLYYDDKGDLYSPQITRRDRVAIGGREFWLVKVPTR